MNLKKKIKDIAQFEKSLLKLFKNFYSSTIDFFDIPDHKKLMIRVCIKDDVKVAAYAIKNSAGIFLSSDWIIKNRDDISGVLLHEFVHLIQNNNPSKNGKYKFLTEGIADYVRCFLLDGKYRASWVPKYESFKKGFPQNKKMVKFFKRIAEDKKIYKSGYVTTAFYFKWIEDNYYKKFTVQLNKDLVNKNFSFEKFCEKKTGKKDSELWKEFVEYVNSL